jgi:4,5-dihydroxyphthalate decarboxylase
MANLKLTFASGLYDRMLPLYTGDVKPEGIDLEFVRIESPREIFDRMAGKMEFDASEFSCSEFISRRAAGDDSFVAIPVFPSRVFRHGMITVNRQFIKSPKDFEGKRIGVPLYTMTAAIFIKGHLQRDYGVDLSGITWVQGAINGESTHGNPTVMPLVKPVKIEKKPEGRTLSDMISDGEIAGIIGTTLPLSMKSNPDVVRLFPNYRDIEKDLWRTKRIFPIMHLVAIKREVHEKHPEVAKSLYDAFVKAKKLALEKMYYIGALRYMLPFLPADLDEIDEVFGGDPWPYGFEPNRPTLEAMNQYMEDQFLIDRKVNLDDLFVLKG